MSCGERTIATDIHIYVAEQLYQWDGTIEFPFGKLRELKKSQANSRFVEFLYNT